MAKNLLNNQSQNYLLCTIFVCITEAIAVVGFGLIFFWGYSFSGGFGWREKPKQEFRLHPVLMSFGLLFMQVGFIAAYDSHVLAKPPIPDFMSLHSWIGLLTLSLFTCQFIFSFLCFMKPGFSNNIRSLIMPIHRISGVIIFILSYASVMMGLCEKAAWAMKCWTEQGYLCSEMLVMNFFGLIATLYSSLVVFAVSNQKWIRIEQTN